jgi:hypothetical protein
MLGRYERTTWLALYRWRQSSNRSGSGFVASSRGQMVLLIAIVLGIALASFMPEASVLLSAVDAIGLDFVTILVALELRYYLAIVFRIGAAPLLRSIYRLGPIPICEPYTEVMRACPTLRCYVVIWPIFVLATWPLFFIVLARSCLNAVMASS